MGIGDWFRSGVKRVGHYINKGAEAVKSAAHGLALKGAHALGAHIYRSDTGWARPYVLEGMKGAAGAAAEDYAARGRSRRSEDEDVFYDAPEAIPGAWKD